MEHLTNDSKDRYKSVTGPVYFLHKASLKKRDHIHAVKVKTVTTGQGKWVTIDTTLKKMKHNNKKSLTADACQIASSYLLII
jgi:hypothetical protein